MPARPRSARTAAPRATDPASRAVPPGRGSVAFLMLRFRPLVVASFGLALFAPSLLADPNPPRAMDGAALRAALRKLNVVGTAVMISAHPDDENTALIAWLSRGKMVRTAYLSLTRGDG